MQLQCNADLQIDELKVDKVLQDLKTLFANRTITDGLLAAKSPFVGIVDGCSRDSSCSTKGLVYMFEINSKGN